MLKLQGDEFRVSYLDEPEFALLKVPRGPFAFVISLVAVFNSSFSNGSPK